MRHLPHLHANRRTPADAPNYIFGYATGNDFTARDLQSRSTQWMLDKSLDGSAPVGPWLVTADLADGDNLKIECRVNGEVRQSSNTSDMVFNCKQLVSYISRYFTGLAAVSPLLVLPTICSLATIRKWLGTMD